MHHAVAMLILALATLRVCGAEDALTWTKIADNGPDVSAHFMGYDPKQHRLFVFGGKGPLGIVNHTWTYDIELKTWQRHAMLSGDIVPPARFSFVGAVSEDQNAVYVVSGEGRDPAGKKKFYNDAWRFDLATLKWEQVDKGDQNVKPGGNRPTVRYGSVGGISPKSPNKLWFSHGFSNIRFSDTWFFDLKKHKWVRSTFGGHEYSPTYPHGRCLGCAGFRTSEKDSFVLFGGCLSGGGTGGPCPAADTWHWNADHWENGPTRPTPRSWCSMASDPRQGSGDVILYGGTETSPTDQTLYVDAFESSDAYIFSKDNMWHRIKVKGKPPVRKQKMSMAHAINSRHAVPGKFSEYAVYMHGGSPLGAEVWMLQGDWTNNQEIKESPYWFSLPQLHGIMMFFGWGVFLQLGGFSARYLRGWGSWFYVHWICNTIGIVIAFFAIIPAYLGVLNSHFLFTHGGLGLVIMIFGIANPVMAAFRCHPTPEADRGPDYVWPTIKRFVFNMFHHYVGRLALALALINITLGLFLVLAPAFLIVIWLVYVTAIVVAYIVGEYHLRTKGRFKKADTQAADTNKNDAEVEMPVAPINSDHKQD